MSHNSTGVAAQSHPVKRGDGSVPPIMIAHTPSPVIRLVHDLEAELQGSTLCHESVASLCDRLLQNLLQHFQTVELTAILPERDRAEPISQAEAKHCIDQRQLTIAQATQLVHRSRESKRDLSWRRQLSREFTLLRHSIDAQQRREMELVRQAYLLDVQESD
jgi:hypothetical protein